MPSIFSVAFMPDGSSAPSGRVPRAGFARAGLEFTAITVRIGLFGKHQGVE
jgi:hypothetical protein